MNSEYTATIGIECHVQLKTKTKLFSAVSNDSRSAAPNTLVSHVCLGMPGALPVLNKKAVELASRAAYALNSVPQKFSKFDRKHYFYPDLPKGYQISQFDQPIILGGYIDIVVDGKTKRIGITRAHLEEDAGKSTHPTGSSVSFVDLNRAGTPLLEIVSEPDMHTAQEAKAYAYELYLHMKYAGISDADLYHGNMRFDVNVSVSKTNELGTRTETKNLNSFKSVEKSVEYEIKRQIDLLEKGQKIIQETRGWDDAKQKTISQRTKEDAHDYRYMPDPDIPPIVLEDEYIKQVKNNMSKMPNTVRSELSSLGVHGSQVETIVAEPELAIAFVHILPSLSLDVAKQIAHWLSGEIVRLVEEKKWSWHLVVMKLPALVTLSELIESSKISGSAAKELLADVVEKNDDPLVLAKQKNLLQESDESALQEIINEVIAENRQALEDIKNGEMKALGFLVGQVMKKTGGKANPGVVNTLLKHTIDVI